MEIQLFFLKFLGLLQAFGSFPEFWKSWFILFLPVDSMEERIFSRPFWTIFTDVTLFYLILINLDLNSCTELVATVLDSTNL